MKTAVTIIFILMILVTSCKTNEVAQTTKDTPVPPTTTEESTMTPESTIAGEETTVTVVSSQTTETPTITMSPAPPLTPTIVVEAGPEYVYLAGSPEEKQILEDFVEDFQERYKEQHGKEWTFEDVPSEYRLHWKDQEGNDLGEVEYGVLNYVWENVEDDTLPNYNTDFGFMSGVIVGVVEVGDWGGMDKLVKFSEARDGRIMVNLIDTVDNSGSTQTYVFGGGYVSKDQNPIFYSGSRFGGVEDVKYVQTVKKYFEDEGEPFQVLVYYALNQENYYQKMLDLWDNVSNIYIGSAENFIRDEEIRVGMDFNATGMFISSIVSSKLGLGN